jgi:hypothetical protein
MSKRIRFNKIKNLQSNLKKYNAFSIDGYFPLFNTIDDAIAVSPESSYHIHEFESVEYYMPNGLEMGKTQFHGDYDVQAITQTTAQPETIQPEQPSVVTITPIEPEQEEEEPPTPTYTPPPSTPSGGSGGGGGGY